MSQKSQLKSGVVLSYFNLIIGNVIPFFYTPIMLRLLGQSEYGLYSLATSVTSYLSLMNLGIGSAVVRYLVKFRTNNDKDGEGRVLGLFSCVFYIIALLTLIIGLIIAFNIDLIYSQALSADELQRIRVLTILLTVNSALSFAFTVYNSVVIVHERFIFQQIIHIIGTILPPIVNIVLLSFGFSSIGLVVSALSVSTLTYILNIIYSFKVIRIKPIFKNMPFYMLKEVLVFSFFIFITNVVNVLHAATDKVIIGAFLGTVATAVYNIGLTFRNIVQSLSTTISSLLVPKVTTMVDSRATESELTDLFIKVGRLQFLIVGLAVGGFCAFGREFISLFAGKGYEESYFVAILLIIPMTVPLIQNTGVSIINAQNKHKFRAIVTLITALLNVATTILLVQEWGIIGAAFTTCCCNIIGSIFCMNIYYHKVIKLNIPLFWKNILRLSITPLALTLITLYLSKHIDFKQPFIFLAGVIVYTLLYSVFTWFNLNSYEKDMIKRIFFKFIRRRKNG